MRITKMRTTWMPLLLLSAGIVALRCDTRAATPSASLQHHEVRADQLPKPYATHSAGNPAQLVKRPANATLHLPPGFHIEPYADGFDEPRNLALAPNGDVFVAESTGGRITILRDHRHYAFASDLDRPFGLAFHDGYLYAGLESAVVRFPYTPGQTIARNPPERIVSLPPGGHVTRNVLFSRDGSTMYVAVGSSGNDNVESDARRAAISVMQPDGKNARTFASGLRNPVGLALEPNSGALWTTVNERDGLGDELVPDYVTDVRDGAFYGWPYAYIGTHEDPRHQGERRDLVAKSIVPSVLIESHSAPLGLVFYSGAMFPPEYRGRAFVALHGSWNRSTLTGYKIISIPFRDGHPAGGYDDFVTGWIADPRGKAWGRPVGLLVLTDGSLLIADDGGNMIWRVTYSHP